MTARDDRCDLLHVTDEDVSDAVRLADLSPEQRRAIDLLELNPDHLPRVRLTRGQWGWVNRVVSGLRSMGVPDVRETGGKPLSGRRSDSAGQVHVPTPRSGSGAIQGVK